MKIKQWHIVLIILIYGLIVFILNNYIEGNEEKINTLFSYLDKGIDDVESGRLHSVDSAFQIIRDRIDSEL